MSHTIFILLKELILSNKPLHMGGTINYRDCKSNLHKKDKDYIKGVTFMRFNPVIHAGNPVHTLYLSPIACTPVHSRYVTSDSDVCEVDLNVNQLPKHCASEEHPAEILQLHQAAEDSLATMSRSGLVVRC